MPLDEESFAELTDDTINEEILNHRDVLAAWKECLLQLERVKDDWEKTEKGSSAKLSFSPEQARRYLGVSLATLKSWREQKKGPPFKKSGIQIRYSYSALLDQIQNQIVHEVAATKELQQEKENHLPT